MKRLVPFVLATVLLVAAPSASASDASLENALKPYKSRLTSDITYLAIFSAPSRSGATSALSRLAAVGHDLAGAIRAASGQRASTHNGSRGKSLLISALNDATRAVVDARASAGAARSGHGATARTDARAEQAEINRAVPLFEQGGRLLHLF